MSVDALYHLIEKLNKVVSPIAHNEKNFDTLLQQISHSQCVMLGEATHGTEEFYRARIAITERLIKEFGFMAVAIEGDWPDVHVLHRYVQGKDAENSAEQALQVFQRFPVWMWRNTCMPPFLNRLRHYNASLASGKGIGLYGLDLYSLHASIQAVVRYLQERDPEAAERAKSRYACLDHMNTDPQLYGYLSKLKNHRFCMQEVLEQLMELQKQAFTYVQKDERGEDEYFFALQNARLVKNAEKYYRNLLEGQVTTWNIRDGHMAETINNLAEHLERRFNKPAKIVIWAHNSHVGDGRATEMDDKGEINLGQLMRKHYALNAYLVGFSTYEGIVTAASNWDEPAQRKIVQPGLPGSYEALFHQLKHKNFVFNIRANTQLHDALMISRLQRAIGVVYRPETERFSHYFLTKLPLQFDSIIHIDETSEVTQLDAN